MLQRNGLNLETKLIRALILFSPVYFMREMSVLFASFDFISALSCCSN